MPSRCSHALRRCHKNRPSLASKPSTADTYRATTQLQPQGAPTCLPAKRHRLICRRKSAARRYMILRQWQYMKRFGQCGSLHAPHFPRSFLPTEIQDTPEQSATIAMETRYTINGLTSAKCSLASRAATTAKSTARYAITLPP